MKLCVKISDSSHQMGAFESERVLAYESRKNYMEVKGTTSLVFLILRSRYFFS